ncbi:MAG: hypothetical protein AAB116_24605, partial [Candidatus Poribacteria bacterium]
FTFRLVEMVKRIKINPISPTKGLPWGLSLATGLVAVALSINPHLVKFDWFNVSSFLSSSKARVLEVGEIPVNILDISQIPNISKGVSDGKDSKQPDMHALLMAPQAEVGEWTRKTDMPIGRLWPASAVLDGKIYVIAGVTKVFSPSDTVEMYDPELDKWETKASLPYTNYAFTASAVNGKIYVIGGWPGKDLNTVEEYNPVLDKWTKKADMPTARGFTSAAVVNGVIYVIGGGDSAVVEAYDPAADRWSRKADIPLAGRYKSASVGNKIYSFGGENSGEMCDISSCPQPYVYEYDTLVDKWTKKANMPKARAGGGISVDALNGKIYVVGGVIATPNRDDLIATSSVEIYDPITDTWEVAANLSGGRCYHSSSVVGGGLYIIGGGVNANWAVTSKVEFFDTGLTSVSPQGKLTNTWGKIKAK